MKLSILFVDDETNILKGIERMLFPFRKEWNMGFVENGNKALEYIENNKVDVIISDMRMPEMDGAQLLEKIKEKDPQIIRIILSGQSDNEKSLKSTRLAHQYLAKPFDSDKLKKILEKTIKLRELLNKKELVNFVNGIGNLPVLPKIFTQIESELKNRDISLNKIGDLIATDITLSAKILQIVNSAFFGLPTKVSNVSQATTYLGINIIKSLILSIGVFTQLKLTKENEFYLENLWEHSLQVANLAKKIASIEGFEKSIIEEAYTAGLLHDLGKIILFQKTNYYSDVFNLMENDEIKFEEAEKKLYGASHSEIGGYLIGLWGLQDEIIEAVAFHHTPKLANDDSLNILYTVHIANSLANIKISNKSIDCNNIIEECNFDSIYTDDVNFIERLKKYEGTI